jgi:hypothetical protein
MLHVRAVVTIHPTTLRNVLIAAFISLAWTANGAEHAAPACPATTCSSFRWSVVRLQQKDHVSINKLPLPAYALARRQQQMVLQNTRELL